MSQQSPTLTIALAYSSGISSCSRPGIPSYFEARSTHHVGLVIIASMSVAMNPDKSNKPHEYSVAVAHTCRCAVLPARVYSLILLDVIRVEGDNERARLPVSVTRRVPLQDLAVVTIVGDNSSKAFANG